VEPYAVEVQPDPVGGQVFAILVEQRSLHGLTDLHDAIQRLAGQASVYRVTAPARQFRLTDLLVEMPWASVTIPAVLDDLLNLVLIPSHPAIQGNTQGATVHVADGRMMMNAER
jgi:hypothetical protein